MKKILQLIACLNISVSSIAMGAALDVDGGGYLVGVDRLSQKEISLVRQGEFQYNPVSDRFENDDVALLGWNPGTETNQDFNLDRILRQVCLPTTEVEFSGNLSSGVEMPVGGSFTKTQRIFSKGEPHNITFTFTRLPAGMNSDNRIQYSVEITVEGGSVKRTDAMGTAIDSSFGATMIMTFNQRGQLNLFDYDQPTESNVPSKLYIEWYDPDTADPLAINLKWGKGKGASPVMWTGSPVPLATGNITAYDGVSLITYSQQDGGYAISRFLNSKEPLQFSWIEKATVLSSNFSSAASNTVRATTEIEFSGNLSSGSPKLLPSCFPSPEVETLTKTQPIFDSLGMQHTIIFTFTRLPAGTDSDNQVQYSVEITIDGGVIKRNNTLGTVIDSTGAPMVMTFNQTGQLNLFDYDQPTESNIAPRLYIEWNDVSINSEPQYITLNLGKGKGGSLESLAEGNLTAYDGPSLITDSKQDGLGMGRYERVSVSELGAVSAHYSNRLSTEIGCLAFAIVPNPGGLKKMGMSYRITESSGLPTIALGGQTGWGKLKFIAPALAKEDYYTRGATVEASSQSVVIPHCMEGAFMPLAEAAGNE